MYFLGKTRQSDPLERMPLIFKKVAKTAAHITSGTLELRLLVWKRVDKSLLTDSALQYMYSVVCSTFELLWIEQIGSWVSNMRAILPILKHVIQRFMAKSQSLIIYVISGIIFLYVWCLGDKLVVWSTLPAVPGSFSSRYYVCGWSIVDILEHIT